MRLRMLMVFRLDVSRVGNQLFGGSGWIRDKITGLGGEDVVLESRFPSSQGSAVNSYLYVVQNMGLRTPSSAEFGVSRGGFPVEIHRTELRLLKQASIDGDFHLGTAKAKHLSGGTSERSRRISAPRSSERASSRVPCQLGSLLFQGDKSWTRRW